MSKIGIFMADGCEEIEGLTVVDIEEEQASKSTRFLLQESR